MPLPEPKEVACVDRIPEHPMDFRLRHAPIAAAVAKADVKRFARER